MTSTAHSPSVPSPDEEDISRASAWTGERSSAESSSSGARRRKEKESDQETLHEDETADAEAFGETYSGADEYPPTKEEEAESRRIEENLRNWETAERERRKAVRASTVSATPATTGPSLVADLSRRASWLWPGSRAKQASLGGVGTHRALRNADDTVPLDDIEASPAVSPSPPPSPGAGENPFITPGGSTLSLNDAGQSSIMKESVSINPFNDGDLSPTTPTAKHPKLKSSLSRQPAPPPQPLDLPRPRSPPPWTEIPHTNRPPEPVPPPVVASVSPSEPPEDIRWWTEWLCGCSEGRDRGGDHQAGRTNPFE